MMALYIANGLRTIMIDDKNKIYTHNILHVPVYTVIVVYSVLYVQRGSLLYCLYLYGCTVYILYELEQKENPSGNYQKFRIMVFIAYHLRGQSFMKKMEKKDLRN
jgi:hypothetical protein